MLVLDPLFVGHYTAEHWAFHVLWQHGIAKEVKYDLIVDKSAFLNDPLCENLSGKFVRIDTEFLKPIQEREENA